MGCHGGIPVHVFPKDNVSLRPYRGPAPLAFLAERMSVLHGWPPDFDSGISDANPVHSASARSGLALRLDPCVTVRFSLTTAT